VTVAAPGPGAGSESPGGRRSAWAWRPRLLCFDSEFAHPKPGRRAGLPPLPFGSNFHRAPPERPTGRAVAFELAPRRAPGPGPGHCTGGACARCRRCRSRVRHPLIGRSAACQVERAMRLEHGPLPEPGWLGRGGSESTLRFKLPACVRLRTMACRARKGDSEPAGGRCQVGLASEGAEGTAVAPGSSWCRWSSVSDSKSIPSHQPGGGCARRSGRQGSH
jgi:hypothetical protein